MHVSSAHIAGIGTAETTHAPLDQLVISAGTKALLDAGITYRHVDKGIACFLDLSLRVPTSSFEAFGSGLSIDEVDNKSAFFTAVQSIASRQSDCVLLVGLDEAVVSTDSKLKVMVVAMVLVSDRFLKAHAYLRDSAIRVRACSMSSRVRSQSLKGLDGPPAFQLTVKSALRQAQLEATEIQAAEAQYSAIPDIRQALGTTSSNSIGSLTGSTGFASLRGLVWKLRGWTSHQPPTTLQHCLQFVSEKGGLDKVVILCRSDGGRAPVWSEVENLRDGRERLGYNPAVETRDVTREDLEAVRADRGMMTNNAAVTQLRLPARGGDRAALARL